MVNMRGIRRRNRYWAGMSQSFTGLPHFATVAQFVGLDMPPLSVNAWLDRQTDGSQNERRALRAPTVAVAASSLRLRMESGIGLTRLANGSLACVRAVEHRSLA